MARLCERPGCSATASVAYGFEAEHTMVWIEPLTPDNADSARVGGLCRRHADSLTAPRGWWLDDRRIDRPRLFAVSDAPDSGTTHVARRSTAGNESVEPPADDQPSRRRARRSKPSDADNTSELPFVDPAATPEPDPAPEARVVGVVPGHEHVVPDVGGPVAIAAIDLDETKATPWTPTFDRTDDLGGVLAARSPLLARAFGVTKPADP